MFEKEIKFISDFSINRVRDLGSSFTYEKLSAVDLHPAIHTYISAELDYMIYTDRKKLLENSIFDYSGRSILEHFNEIGREIKRNKLLSFEDVKKLIIQAVSFNVNYVVRPKWSVTKLIYNDRQYVSVEEMERMLNYLYYYDYIKNVLSAYLSKRKVLQLTLTEFDLILNKIDRELFKANAEELINNALVSIADFFNIGGVEKNRISVQAVEILLKEKNLTDYLMKLRHAIPDESKKKYDIEDIKNIFYSTEPIEPDSIAGYETDEVVITGEEPVLKDEPEKFVIPEEEAKPEVQPDEQKEEIKDEGIIIEAGEEEQVSVKEQPEEKTEAEEPLPIEEEFLMEDEPEKEIVADKEETKAEENLHEEISDTEEETGYKEDLIIEEFPADEKDLEIEKELNELMEEGVAFDEGTFEEDEIKSEEVKTEVEEDELLSFYEKELAALDDDLALTGKPSETMVEELERQEEETEELKSEKETVEEIPEEKEEPVISEDEFDLSIFEDAQEEEQPEEIVSQTEEEIEIKEAEETPQAKEETAEESPEEKPETVEQKDETKEKEEPLVSDEVVSNEIVNEMIEDFFRDEARDEVKKEPEEEPLLSEETEEIKDEKPAESEPEEQPRNEEEIVMEEEKKEESIEDILNNLDLEDEISHVIEDIDKLLEKTETEIPTLKEEITETPSAEEKTGEQPEETFAIEEEFKDETEQPAFPEENTTEEVTEIKGEEFKDEELQFEEPAQEQPVTEEEKAGTIEETEPEIKEEPVEQMSAFEQDAPFEETAEQQQQVEIPERKKDLFTYLKKKEIKKIISNVFAGDDEDFVTTVEKISECVTYKEATEILKGVFFTYRVSPYSKEAVILTNAVSNYFRQV